MNLKTLRDARRRLTSDLLRPFHKPVGKLSNRKVFDCFLFFNELDLLELRFETLYGHVDKFVLAECPLTMAGQPKPLYYQDNVSRFKKYADKIEYVLIQNPAKEDYVLMMENKPSSELFQRNYLAKGLGQAGPEDLVFISDLDEIPNPNCLEEVKGAIACGVPLLTLLQHWHLLFLNARVVESLNTGIMNHPCGWFGTMVCKRSTLRDMFKDCPSRLWGCKWDRAGDGLHKIENGGWHFSYMGGFEKVKLKLLATALQTVGPKDAELLKRKIFANARFDFIEVDASFPLPVRNNVLQFQEMMSSESGYNESVRKFVEEWGCGASV